MKAVIALVDSNTRTEKRTPVTLKIKFKSETIEQFIERYAVDVSKGGIFVRTKEPLAVGTTMKFEFQLKDTTTLIAGEGTVVWTRENDLTRPNVAPGMGVRFDKLAEGSQVVLDKILLVKSKGAAARGAETKPPAFADVPMRQPRMTDPPEAFNDAPTRVGFLDGPTRVAMVGESEENIGRSHRPTMPNPTTANSSERWGASNDFTGEREKTPLPGPMPFHSDAEDFPEETFAEATKIRSLDELAASTLQNPLATAAEPGDAPSATGRAPRASVAPIVAADEVNEPRALPRPSEPIPSVSTVVVQAQASVAQPNVQAKIDAAPQPKIETSSAIASDRQKRPTDNPAIENRPSGKALDTAPSPRSEARSKVDANSQAAKQTAKVSVAAAPAAVSSVAMQKQPSSGGAGLFIAGLAIAAAAAGGIWYFVIREQKDELHSRRAPATGSPTKAPIETPPPVISQPPLTGSNTGSNEGSGSAAVVAPIQPGSAAVAAELATTIITTRGDKSLQIEVVGTDQKGPSPLSAKLEKGKSFTVRVTGPGWKTSEITVTGGVAKANIDAVAKARIIHVESTPTAAAIFVDGVATGKSTPADVEIKTRSAMARITLRKPGFNQSQSVVAMTSFQEEGDVMKASLAQTLVVAVARPRPPVDTTPTPPDGATTDGKPTPSGDPQPDPKPTETKPAPADGKPADTKPESKPTPSSSPSSSGEPQPTWVK